MSGGTGHILVSFRADRLLGSILRRISALVSLLSQPMPKRSSWSGLLIRLLAETSLRRRETRPERGVSDKTRGKRLAGQYRTSFGQQVGVASTQ
jgi:hypothetical protein